MTEKKSNNMINAALFIIYVTLSAGGLILFKLGSGEMNFNAVGRQLNLTISLWMVLGIICYCVSFVIWLVIVGRLPLSFAMPLSVGLVNLCVLIGSMLVLHEKISLIQWVGVGVILAGLFLINTGSK